MEYKVALPYSQEFSTAPYPGPHKSGPLPDKAVLYILLDVIFT
jgi:hypothetical protein